MAGNNTVRIDLEIASNGMDRAVNNSQTIRDNLTAAAGAMNQVSGGGAGSTPNRAPGGTAGSRAVSQRASGQEYAAQRGVTGATGASARNFAAESQGLGGLVRLYATFAANIYVAAAAFKTLSTAMDTSNMIKGLDQLGAASGRNLGSLSKQLAAASDGAINLRDAAQAVAQASASGLGGNQILELGDIAKKASQALGISMPDALSRISRGVTKLEPELLDELGIFTKLDESSRKYALALGKPVSALTDFEKRQGFANAVAEEGAKKFANIKLDVNPYDKLLASFQNLAQTGLELVNKILGPIVKLLSESPLALAGLIGLLGKSLLSQAIPALGQYRRGLEDQATAATAALETARRTRAEHRSYIDTLEASAIVQRDNNAATRAGIALNQLSATVTARSRVANILSRAPDVTQSTVDVAALRTTTELLERQQGVLQTRNNANFSSQRQREIDQINATTAALRERIAAQEALNRIENMPRRTGGPAPTSQEAMQDRQLRQATSRSTSIGVLQEVSRTIDSSSLRDAFSALNRGVSESSANLTGLGRVMTYVRGVGLILSAGLAGIVSWLSTFNLAGVVATTVLAGMDLVFSKNAKSAEEAKKAFELVTSSLENLDRTVNFIKAKDPLEQFNTESLVARGNAVNDLAKNLTDAFSKSAKEIADASWWDDLKDRFSKIWGGDTATRNAENLAKTVVKTLDAGGSETKAGKQIIELLGGLPTNTKQLTEQLQEADGALGPKLLENIKKVGIELGNLGSQSQELDEAFKTISKTFDTIVVSALPTDSLTKLGQEYLTLGDKIGKALKNPMTAIVKLQELSMDESKLKLFSPKLQENIINYRAELTKVTAEMVKLSLENKKLNTQEAEIDNARKQRTAKLVSALGAGAQQQGMGPRSLGDGQNIAQTQKAVAQESADSVDRALERSRQFEKSFQNATEKGAKLLVQAQSESYEKGTKLIEQSIGRGFAEAKATISGAFADRLGDTETGIKRRTDLAIEANNRAKQDLEAKAGLIDSQEGLRKALELATIETALNTAQLAMAKPFQLPADIASNKENIATLQQQKLRLTNPVEADKKYGALPVPKGKTPAQLAQEALGAAKAKIDAENSKLLIQQEDKLAALRSKNNSTEQSQQVSINNTMLERYKIITKGLPYYTAESLAAQQKQAAESEAIKYLEEQKQYTDKIADAQRTIAEIQSKPKSKVTADDIKEVSRAQAVILDNIKLQDNLKKEQKQRQETADKGRESEARDNAKSRLDYEQGLEARKTEIQTKSDQVLQEKRQTDIEVLKNLGINGAVELAKLENDLAVKQETERTALALAEIEKRKTAEIAAKTALVTTLKAPGSEAQPGDIATAEADLAASKAYYDSMIAGETSLSNLVLARIGYNNTLKTQAAEQAVAMYSLKTTVESLSVVFGDLGKKFGDSLTGILKATQDANTKKSTLDQKYGQDKLKQEADLAERVKSIQSDAMLDSEQQAGLEAEARADANKQKLATDKSYAKDSAKLEFDRNANIISATKGMFKEKTFAYKALAAVEKVMHITKLAMMVKEMFFDATATASSVANSGVRTAASVVEAGVLGVKAVVGAIASLPFPLDLVAGAAVAAVIAGLLGSIGGKSHSVSGARPSEADLAKASGTGREYNSDGKLVAREGGVVGDPNAKASSLSKSMDIVGQVFFDSLDSESSNLIKYLKAIDDNTKGLAKAMLEQAGFFTGGDILGIKEGKDGGGFLGSLFGKSSTTIDKAGLYVEGTIDQLTNLADGVTGGIAEIYAVVTEESSALFGLISSSNTYRTAKDLGAEGRKAIDGIFTNWKAALLLTAQGLEGSSDRVAAALQSFGKITIDVVRGDMSATDYATAVMNELSVKMNQATLAAMPYIKDFTQIGEEYYEAANRLRKEAATISQGMRMLGKQGISAGEGIAGALHKIEVSQAFLSKFGKDLSKGADAIQFYFDTFLTETQRNTHYATELADGFKEIGYTTTLTLDQYNAAIASLDINDPGQAAQLANLLKLAPAYDKVNQAQKKTAALQVDLLEAEGHAAQATAARRKVEYAAMSETDAAIQRRIDALSDEKTAYDKLHTALTDTITGIQTSIKSLRDFANSILTGPNSLASPGEKLAATKRSFDQAIQAAKGPRDDPTQRRLADQAAQDVKTFGQQLGDQATTMFASSTQAQEILDYVASQTIGVADVLALAETDTQKQLDYLESSAGYLKTIAETNNQLLTEYKTAHADALAATGTVTPKNANEPVVNNTPPGTLSDVVASQQTQLAAQQETNRLLQEQIDVQKAQLLSNATAMQAQTDALTAAAEDRRQLAEYATRNAPVENYGP